jgi:hypothetical protein
VNNITTLWRRATAASRTADRLGTLEAITDALDAWRAFNADPEVRKRSGWDLYPSEEIGR